MPGQALVQVVDQQVPDRAAGQVIAVDQLPGGQLAADARVEHPRPGRGARRQEARRVQQLVEVRSSVIAVSPGTRTGLQQLQAVPDGDIASHAALDGHDDRDLEHRPAGGGDADRRRPGGLLQRGEAGRIPDAGHVGGQMRRRRRGQQPAQVRPDHVAADQQSQGAAEAAPYGLVAGRDPSSVLEVQPGDVAPVLIRCGPAARPATGPAR